MHQIDGVNYKVVGGIGRLFQKVSRILSTHFTAEWLNAVQQEIAGVITGAGLTLRVSAAADAAASYASQLFVAIGDLITSAINTEATARSAADNTLQTNINNEATARSAAIAALGTFVDFTPVVAVRTGTGSVSSQAGSFSSAPCGKMTIVNFNFSIVITGNVSALSLPFPGVPCKFGVGVFTLQGSSPDEVVGFMAIATGAANNTLVLGREGSGNFATGLMGLAGQIILGA